MATVIAPDSRAPYSRSEELAHTLTAGLGIVACAVAIPWLAWVAAGDPLRLAAAMVFGVSALAMFATSVIYHWERAPERKHRLRKLDHSAIYLLIAGTYTPFTLLGLRGTLGWSLFAAIWALALAGIVFKLFFTGRFKLLSTLIYVAMGWMVIVAIKPVMAALDTWTLGWLLAGGLFYTLGTYFYHRESIPYSHAIWHLFCIGGSTCHYIAVMAQVLPR